nr:hypothetical protein [uncultured Desulfobulbus sp.]
MNSSSPFGTLPVGLQPGPGMENGPILMREPTPLFGGMVGALTIASAVSIGSNWVDVRNGAMIPAQAVLNGMAKGAAATLILKATSRSTPLQIALAATVLAAAGYMIDATMKKSKRELCAVDATVKP